MSCSLKFLWLSTINIALITVTTLYFKLLLFFYYMSPTLIDPRASIIRLWDPASPIRCAPLSRGPAPTSRIAPYQWPPPARCDWPLPIIIAHRISKCDIILLLNICTIVLIDDLYLYVDTPRCYLLVGRVVPW
jgi:hypothetical protein